MAKLTAPLMSFNARGKLAGSLVFMGWKGLKTVRQYVTPANPQTADQVVQRNFFTQAVFAWRNYLDLASTLQAWDVAANVDPKPLSGFNLFVRNALALLLRGGDGVVSSSMSTAPALGIIGHMVEIVDGTVGVEAGSFELLVGTKEASLLPHDTVAIVGGDLDFTVSAPFVSGQTIFCQIRKDNIERSGIFKAILT